jgi:hypothetical protein
MIRALSADDGYKPRAPFYTGNRGKMQNIIGQLTGDVRKYVWLPIKEVCTTSKTAGNGVKN